MAGLAALAAAGLSLTGCSGSGSHRGAASTTLPPGAVTVDRWDPPVLTGGPSQANFCLALTALYRHMGDLSHVASLAVGQQILSDYVAYSPVVVSEAPPAIRTEARIYLTAVAGYLGQLAKADLSLARLPTGALGPLATTTAKAAATAVLGYSSTQCHYTIGAN